MEVLTSARNHERHLSLQKTKLGQIPVGHRNYRLEKYKFHRNTGHGSTEDTRLKGQYGLQKTQLRQNAGWIHKCQRQQIRAAEN